MKRRNCLPFCSLRMFSVFLTMSFTVSSVSCIGEAKTNLRTRQELDYCVGQLLKSVPLLPDDGLIPRSIKSGEKNWRFISYRDWTSGFFPGILWYAYQYTGDSSWEKQARHYSKLLFPLVDSSAIDHDLGFQVFCGLGNAYRLTGDTVYKQILLRAADSLARLYNPRVGTILSWPRPVAGNDWPARHNTIMDNMINLELLFWASANGGGKRLYDMAVSHAATTMENHFRPDYSSYHVVVYDTATGKKTKAITHQGYSDSSMWARGQSWAIYGFTMVARETGDARFLDFARKVSDVYLSRLPEDLVPYWDFDDPGIPDVPRDASAAAVTASGLLELSTLVKDSSAAHYYRTKAEAMLASLSSKKYQSRAVNDAFLLHSTGHKPAGGEIDASIIYADYYYLEALLRQRALQQRGKI